MAVWSAHDNERFAEVTTKMNPQAWREHVHWSVEHQDDDDQHFHNVLFLACKAP